MIDKISAKFQNQTSQKRAMSSLCITTVLSLAMMGSASAMLPTPEPELDAPTSSQNAQIIQQGSTSQAATQNNSAVAAKVLAFLVAAGENGSQTLVPVTESTQLQKGNVIEYQGHFTNTSADNQRRMTVTMSIPNEVKLLGSIDPDYPLATVDGSSFSAVPLRSRVGNDIQEVPLDYYRGLRWNIEGLGLGETAVVKYQALVR